MHFDALATACMAYELQRTLCPGRVQAVLLVDADSLGLEVYAHSVRRQLLLVASAAHARVHLVEHKLRRGVGGEPPLLLLARKYLRDALLVDVTQPDRFERVLQLRFEHKQQGAATLVVELIGRQSNLLLLRPDGRIHACLHPHAAGEGVQRVLLPGRAYAPPPPQGKLPPLDDGRPAYYEELAAVLAAPGKLAKVLVGALAGVSPTAGRELAWRAAGDPDAAATATNVLALAAALQSLWAPLHSGQWQPGCLMQDEQVAAFAPYVLQGLGLFVATDTFSAAVAAYYASPPAQGAQASSSAQASDLPAGTPSGQDAYAAQRANVAGLLRRARQVVQRRLAGLAADEPAAGEAQRLRTAAEWLLALSSRIEPGQQLLEVPLEGESLQIALDAAFTPVEQAQRMFRRAAKLERAEVFIPQRRAELEQDLLLVEQLALDLQHAANQPEIAAVQSELQAAGLLGGQKAGTKAAALPPSGPLRLRSLQGLEIVVGRNARQNERVTFGEAHADDLWLHVRGAPGAHVVIRGAGRTADDETVLAAAQLAAYHSSRRGEASVPVMVTRKRWVQRAPGGKVGQVLVRQEERTVTVAGEMPPLTG